MQKSRTKKTNMLPKRHIFLKSPIIVATPYNSGLVCVCVFYLIFLDFIYYFFFLIFLFTFDIINRNGVCFVKIALTISRLPENKRLFCKRALQTRPMCCKKNILLTSQLIVAIPYDSWLACVCMLHTHTL